MDKTRTTFGCRFKWTYNFVGEHHNSYLMYFVWQILIQMINIFGLYWGLFFFSAFGELVLAGVFAEVRTFKTNKTYYQTKHSRIFSSEVKTWTFKTNIKYSSGIGRTTTTSRTCPAASLALLCGMPRSTSLLSNLDFFFFIQNLCPKRGSIHWPNLYCSDLSLGHSCLWQPHPRHHPHDQDHPRVHREEVQEVQQRSHKVSTISLHRPFLHL